VFNKSNLPLNDADLGWKPNGLEGVFIYSLTVHDTKGDKRKWGDVTVVK
jgi:hypothetical protein